MTTLRCGAHLGLKAFRDYASAILWQLSVTARSGTSRPPTPRFLDAIEISPSGLIFVQEQHSASGHHWY